MVFMEIKLVLNLIHNPTTLTIISNIKSPPSLANPSLPSPIQTLSPQQQKSLKSHVSIVSKALGDSSNNQISKLFLRCFNPLA
jgi:hypothetical protein